MSEDANNSNPVSGDPDAGGMEFALWLAKLGLSRPTGYRYRRDGKVTTHNVEGREFILTGEIHRFWTRVRAGEFAKKPRGASAKARRASSPPPGRGPAPNDHISEELTTPRPNGPPNEQ
jgi:hypothetical protein